MREVENYLNAGEYDEPKVNGEDMGEFRYADDQALLSKSKKVWKTSLMPSRSIVKIKGCM